MADTPVLPINGPDGDDTEIAGRLQQSFSSVPAATPEQIARCTRAVLEEASRVRSHPAWFRPRWWWAGAAAAVLVVAFTLRPVRLADATRESVDSSTAMDITPEGSTRIVDDGSAVRFELRLPADVERVAIVGDFNGWNSDSTPMRKDATDGRWEAEIPVTPGVHNYAFVIDGDRWLVDPLAPQVPDAGFGPTNAVVVVGSR